MNEFLTNLAMTVVTAAVPILTAYAVSLISKIKDKTIAQTDSLKQQAYITEIADAVSAAVAATSQTYVDALKRAGSFDLEAQKQAAAMALSACISAISPAAKDFIVAAYGDLTEYLTNKIEAEVRSQKNGETLLVGIPAE